MRAAVYRHYGPPSFVHVENALSSVPRPGELLVRVYASTVNRTDCGFLSGKPRVVRFFSGLRAPRATILGCEFAGDVAAVGSGVRSFTVGQRVFGYNAVKFGGHAEYLTISETDLVAEIPAGWSYGEAAPIVEGAHYALNMIRAAKITAGQKVLVNGGTGGIGSAAVQLLVHLGARVTAVCATAHLSVLDSLGAERVVDYTRDDFTTLDDEFDVVLDAVGKSSFGRCRRLLVPGGIYVSSELGSMWQNPVLAVTTPLLRRKRVLFPIPKDTRDDVLLLKGLAESGEFRPIIDRTYSLEQIREAYEYVAVGQKIGNVVIRVRDESSGQ
ncbi:NAD(P)-dependent alcohol dehydrogenase [Cryobacterium sp. TMT1-3]|uniref:NAD(P)-dependent alcohol dehydrogenase n=1 Tax=Cryobacterium luteum TaxID=1424661 RepID=A0A5F0D9K5_9MICO|nr:MULTISPECIES: NAD(P)-dependent alcohol dehydrogenase [Cryobacterium]TFB92305.1 NAD(P)-dependent alcohol dehydrogenase [Cryobacterium luteum]TFC25142.1 NAD(P)-dependent alcohol dehydrogenase [Cryobacterium sp. TMT1-3]